MLKEIPLDELKPGMYVDSIAKQSGEIKITTRGYVSKWTQISTMRKKGIDSVFVDPDKQKIMEAEKPPIEEPQERVEVAFENELGRAVHIHQQGKIIQQQLLQNVSNGLSFDINIPKTFSEKLVGSIDRNPNALLCLTKIREKDTYLLEHSLNVAILLANFARHLGMEPQVINELAFAGFLHDIGKIRVPDEILHKPGKLTPEEFVVMREHVEMGTKVLEEIEQIPVHIIRTVSEHHERLDGFGYPNNIAGDEISLFGRMIAIVDCYDAMTADRCYKKGMPSNKALKILLKESPEKYDQTLVQQFINCIGIYPVGSLVQLSNAKIAMITEHNAKAPQQPKVKVFYSIKGGHYLPPQDIDLQTQNHSEIEKAVLAEEFGLDFVRFFKESIAG